MELTELKLLRAVIFTAEPEFSKDCSESLVRLNSMSLHTLERLLICHARLSSRLNVLVHKTLSDVHDDVNVFKHKKQLGDFDGK